MGRSGVICGMNSSCGIIITGVLHDDGQCESLTQTKQLKDVRFLDRIILHGDIKRAYPVQRAPALYGVWGRVSVASLTLACAMRGDRDSNPGPSGHRR